MKIVGAVLIVLGMLGLVFGGIPYRKTEELARLGDFKMQVTEKKQLVIPPVVSGVVVLAGAALLFGARRSRS